MNLRKGTPGKGAGPRPDSFSYVGVAAGLKNTWNAHLAGEPYWCEEAHEHRDDARDRGTKPCLHWMTNGEVRCARCRQGWPVKCIGWVPLYREHDTAPVIVIVHEKVSDLLTGLKYGDFVLVGRVDKNDSVFVRKSDNRVSLVTEKESRKRPVDVTPDLLTMWKLPELNDWLAGQRSVPAADVPPMLRQRLSVPPPTSDVEALAIDAEKKAPADWVKAVDTIINHAAANVAKPGKNGKHNPNAEGGAK